MTNLVEQKKKKELLYQFGMFAMLGLFAFAFITMAPSVLATTGTDATQDARTIVTTLFDVIYFIVTIVGVFFLVLGTIKFVIAHANEQGPEQQKAIMQLATGIILIALPAVLRTLHLENYITFSSGGGN